MAARKRGFEEVEEEEQERGEVKSDESDNDDDNDDEVFGTKIIVCTPTVHQVDRRTGKFVRAAAARAKEKLDRVGGNVDLG